jgi:hypothetical protein
MGAGLREDRPVRGWQGVPTHAARQVAADRWTSKLGELEDIEHSLRDLEGAVYGSVVQIMKRAVPTDGAEGAESPSG